MSKKLDNIKAENKALQEQNALLAKNVGLSEQALDESRDFSNVLRDQAKQLQFQTTERRELLGVINQINKIATDSFAIQGKELGLKKTNQSITQNIETLEKRLLTLGTLRNKIGEKGSQFQKDINDSIDGSVNSTQNLIKELKLTRDISKEVSNDLGVKTFGGIADIAKLIPGLNRFSEPFQAAADAARTHKAEQMTMLKTGKGLTADKIEELGLTDKLTITNKNNQKQLLTGKAAGKKLMADNVKLSGGFAAGLKSATANFLGPAGLVVLATAALNQFMKMEQAITDMQRDLSLSKGDAANLKQEMAGASLAGGLFGVTLHDQVEAVGALNQGLGGVALTFDSKTRVAAAETLKRLKLSEEAVGNMGVLALATGKSFEELEDTQIASTLAVEKEFGIRLNLKDVLDEANKISGATRVNLEKFPGGLAKAVATAKSLGVEMDSISASAGQLLDFESSIEKELQAELLLGRDINLERARQAALTGDQTALMEELVREAGSLEELQQMNVLQQEALAGALGISVDQLSNQVLQGEALATQRDADLERDQAEAEANAKALSLQEKQAIAMEKIADVASMLGPLLLGIAAAAAAAAIALTFGTITPVIAASIGAIGLVVAGLGAQFISDGMIPSSSGRGPFAITDSFGATAITAAGDGVAVSPNISRNNGNSGGGNTDMRTTNALLRQLVAKREVVEIDGTNAGTAFGTSARRIQ